MVRHAMLLLVLGLLGGMAWGAEAGLPAVIHLTIVDGQERAVEGAKVTVSRPEAAEGDAGVSAESDKEGQVTVTVPIPAVQGYMVRLAIENKGDPAYTVNEFICDNARLDLTCQIGDVRKTTIHVRSPDGRGD